MNQVRNRLIVFSLAAVAILLVVLFGVWREPTYHGHTLTFWVAELWAPGADQERARAALRAMGPKVIPRLLDKIRLETPAWRDNFAWNHLPAPLKQLLPAPQPAEHLREKIPYAISLFGPAAVPPVVRALSDDDREIRVVAADAIGYLGERANGALPFLLPLLVHTNTEFRLCAVYAVSKMGMIRTQALSALTLRLNDPAGGVRQLTARALGSLGPAAEPALPPLTASLNDPDPAVRLEVARALWQIERDTNLVFHIMGELERRQSIHVYRGYLQLLTQMGPAARPAVPEILRSMTNWGTDMSRPIGRALSRIDPSAELLGAQGSSPQRGLGR